MTSLLTQDQIKQLLFNGSEAHRSKDHIPVVKLFIRHLGFTWLLTELDQEEPDIAFGLCDLAMGFPELGYVSLEEITGIPGIKVEPDPFFEGTAPISVYAEAARNNMMIVEDEKYLKEAALTTVEYKPFSIQPL